ncbi:MAG: hypothetical protein ACXW3Z_17385 [Limisphaerales bacterium]
MPFAYRWLLAALWTLILIRPGLAQEAEVTVRLASGRVLQGLVDERSNEETLWLRRERKSSYLRRPIAWSQVVVASMGNEELTKDEILSRATAAPPDQPRARHILAPNVHPVGYYPSELAHDPPRSLAIRAELGNWDGDAALDGLLLQLRPQNARGESTPVVGQVEIECWGLDLRHGKPGGELAFIERWSQPIALIDFTNEGALLKLPFGAVNPIERPVFRPWGLLRVRLSIPGSGMLEAMLDGVQLRPATPVQDWQRISELFPR